MPPTTIELLYFADCPNHERALALVLDAMRAECLTLPIKLIAVETEDEARALAFHGSPTIRIAGADVAPVPAGSRPALACRMYRDADGRPSPTPPRESVVAALRRAAGEGERV
jgi:hypothetical protein